MKNDETEGKYETVNGNKMFRRAETKILMEGRDIVKKIQNV